MKSLLLGGNDHLLVFDILDEVISVIIEFANRHGIEGASFSGVGAFQGATIAYWNWDTKKYENIEVADQVEALAITGNVAMSGDGVKVHAHVVLGRRDGSAIGGHLVRGTVRPTLEIFLRDHRMRLTRKKDAVTGLWLLEV